MNGDCAHSRGYTARPAGFGTLEGKAAGGDPVVIFEDILAQLVANKGAVATAILGKEPVVATDGTPIDPTARKV